MHSLRYVHSLFLWFDWLSFFWMNTADSDTFPILAFNVDCRHPQVQSSTCVTSNIEDTATNHILSFWSRVWKYIFKNIEKIKKIKNTHLSWYFRYFLNFTSVWHQMQFNRVYRADSLFIDYYQLFVRFIILQKIIIRQHPNTLR